MEIRITECRRTIDCEYCHKPIELHSPIIIGKNWFVYNKGTASEAHRYYIHHWHAKDASGSCCWLEQGLYVLLIAEKRIETRGGKTLLLPIDQRKQRLKLLQRHARLVQMLKEEMEKLATDATTSRPVGSWDRVALLGQRLEELKALIQPLGGVPSSWLDKSEQSAQAPPYLEESPGLDISVNLALVEHIT